MGGTADVSSVGLLSRMEAVAALYCCCFLGYFIGVGHRLLFSLFFGACAYICSTAQFLLYFLPSIDVGGFILRHDLQDMAIQEAHLLLPTWYQISICYQTVIIKGGHSN